MADAAKERKREYVRTLAAKFAEKGDSAGWFEALYKEAAGNTDIIPWADLEPNQFFQKWAEKKNLKGGGRRALVVGCGLGDDARYLYDLGFEVTAFDISPTAIEWARKLHKDTSIQFEIADLFESDKGWLGAFDFVLEIYTVQPLPLEWRPRVIDAISSFVAPGGHLAVVTRGRGDNEEPAMLPWPLSRKDLERFTENGLIETDFEVMLDPEDEQDRWVIEYQRKIA